MREEKEKKKESNISFHFGFVVCRFGAASPLSLPLNCGFAADKLRSCPAAELDIFFAHAMPLSFRLSLTSSWTQPRRHICGRLKASLASNSCSYSYSYSYSYSSSEGEGKGWLCSALLIGRPGLRCEKRAGLWYFSIYSSLTLACAVTIASSTGVTLRARSPFNINIPGTQCDCCSHTD